MKTGAAAVGILIFLSILFWTWPENVSAADEETSSSSEIQEDLLEEMDFTEIQNMMDEMLGENSFSLTKAVKALMSGAGISARPFLFAF